MGLFNGKLFKGINKALTKAWDINVQGTKLVGSALFPGAGAMLAQQEANAAQKKLADEANARNLQLWQMTNQYNSPTENMKRLEAAGLNPNMAYGQLGDSRASAPVSTEVPEVRAAKPEGAGAMDSLSTYMQVVNTQEQNKVIRAQAAKVAEEAGLVRVQRQAAEYELGMSKAAGLGGKEGITRAAVRQAVPILRKSLQGWRNVLKPLFQRSSVTDRVNSYQLYQSPDKWMKGVKK